MASILDTARGTIGAVPISAGSVDTYWAQTAARMSTAQLNQALALGDLLPSGQRGAFEQEKVRRQAEGGAAGSQPAKQAQDVVQPPQVPSFLEQARRVIGGVDVGSAGGAPGAQNVLGGVFGGGQPQVAAAGPSRSGAAVEVQPQIQAAAGGDTQAEAFLTQMSSMLGQAFGSMARGWSEIGAAVTSGAQGLDQYLQSPGRSDAEIIFKSMANATWPANFLRAMDPVVREMTRFFVGPTTQQAIADAAGSPRGSIAGPFAGQPEAPAQNTLQAILDRLGIRSELPVTIPGQVPLDFTKLVPGAVELTQPDYSAVRAAFEAGAPTPPQSDPLQAILAALQGAASGASGALYPGTAIAGAGGGALKGILGVREAEQQRQDAFEQARREHQAGVAQFEEAAENARVLGLNKAEEARYAHELTVAKATLDNWSQLQPEVKLTDRGVFYQTVDPETGALTVNAASTDWLERYAISQGIASALGKEPSQAKLFLNALELANDGSPFDRYRALAAKGWELGVLPEVMTSAGIDLESDEFDGLTSLSAKEMQIFSSDPEALRKAAAQRFVDGLGVYLSQNPEIAHIVLQRLEAVMTGVPLGFLGAQ
jgi:hypothetical protein